MQRLSRYYPGKRHNSLFKNRLTPLLCAFEYSTWDLRVKQQKAEWQAGRKEITLKCVFSKENSTKSAHGVYYSSFQLPVARDFLRIFSKSQMNIQILHWLHRLAWSHPQNQMFVLPYPKCTPLGSLVAAVPQLSLRQPQAHRDTRNYSWKTLRSHLFQSSRGRASVWGGSPRIHRLPRFGGFASLTQKGLTAWKTSALISSDRAHCTVSGSYFPSHARRVDRNKTGEA